MLLRGTSEITSFKSTSVSLKRCKLWSKLGKGPVSDLQPLVRNWTIVPYMYIRAHNLLAESKLPVWGWCDLFFTLEPHYWVLPENLQNNLVIWSEIVDIWGFGYLYEFLLSLVRVTNLLQQWRGLLTASRLLT